MSTSRYGQSRETRDILESLRRREQSLDRWERDLRFREDSLTRRTTSFYQNNRIEKNYTPRNNHHEKRNRPQKEKDYSKLAAPRERHAFEPEDPGEPRNDTKNENAY